MSSSSFKHDLFSQFARVAKAMGNGYRLELLEYLAQGERSVDSLAKVSGLTVANTSTATPARTSGDGSTGYLSPHLQLHHSRYLGTTASAPAASLPLTYQTNSDADCPGIPFRWSCWGGWLLPNPTRAWGWLHPARRCPSSDRPGQPSNGGLRRGRRCPE